jgi:TPR repeat protein
MDEQRRLQKQQLARCEQTRQHVVRGDAMLGTVSWAEIDQMLATYRALGEAGVPEAWVGLARYHLDPRGLHRSAGDAAEYACRAILAGSLDGARLLRQAMPALRDDPRAQPPSATQARDALTRLLSADDTGVVHHVLGSMAFDGLGGPQDIAAFVACHAIAAERGFADSLFEMSLIYATGTGAAKDPQKALDYCRRAAERGQPRACYNLGAWYATGSGVAQDEAKARTWYQRASEAGHGPATATLGVMVMTGQGGAADPEHAEQLFHLAEEQGVDVEAFLEQLGL